MKLPKLVLGMMAALVWAGNAAAQMVDTDHVVNVQFGYGTNGSPGTSMNGTSWSSTVAPLQYVGNVWTDDSTTQSGRTTTLTNLPYADSTKGSSTIGFSFDSNFSTSTWQAETNPLTLLQSLVYTGNSGAHVTFTGLDTTKTYDIYLASNVSFAETQFTIGSLSYTISTTTAPSTWINGQNYVHFAAIAPNSSGQIVVNVKGTLSPSYYSVISGFQIAADTSNYGAANDAFLGPFPSWINVKTAYGAQGDGHTDDTLAIQNALNDVGTSGHGSVVYFPAGTYMITEGNTTGIHSGLVLENKKHIALIGQDPATTIIKWNGAQNSTDAMLWASGVTESRFGRITWDGAGSTVAGWAHMYNQNYPGYASTAIYRSDEVFQNMAIGLALGNGTSSTGYDGSDGDNNIIRDRFINCSQAGVRVGSPQSFQNYIWDSEFLNCGTGMDNIATAGNLGTTGQGNFNAYRCFFDNSSMADLHSYWPMWFDFRSNTSFSSRQFLINDGGGQSQNAIVVQNNKILDSQSSATIAINEVGNALLLNNQIRSLSTAVAPIVEMNFLTQTENGPDLNSVGNSYTVSSPITDYGSTFTSPPGAPRWWSASDSIVSASSINNTVPTMPGTPAVPSNFSTNYMDVPTSYTTAQINAIFASPSGWAWVRKGQQPIVHFPAGNYTISSTITIPAGLDVQLVGDSRASTLTWTGSGTGTMFQLNGPGSKAHFYDLTLLGAPGTAIQISSPDQVGAKVYVEGGLWQGFSNFGLYVYECQNVVVECHAFQADGYGSDAGRMVKVIGPGTASSGYTAVFGSDGGIFTTNPILFDVTSQGNFVSTDDYYEGSSPTTRIIQLTGNNTVTFSNTGYDPYASHTVPSIELDNATGQATFVNTLVNAYNSTDTSPEIYINGETSATNALFLGVDMGTGNTTFTNYFSRTGSTGTVSLLNSKYTTVLPGYFGSYQVPNAGSSFAASTLNQLSTVNPTFPATSGSGITEVRLVDVNIGNGTGNGANCVQVGP